MSGLLDHLLPGWAGDVVLGPVVDALSRQYNAYMKSVVTLFGTGQAPRDLPPPPAPPALPSTGGTGPTQDEVDKLNEQIAQLGQQITRMHEQVGQATAQSEDNSTQGRQDTEGIINDGEAAQAALTPQTGTAEGQAAALQAMQQQIDALTQTIQSKASNANGIADALRTLGTVMPGMGMPSVGMPPMGLPGMAMPFGGLGGGFGGAPQVAALPTPAPPAVTAHPTEEPPAPPRVTTPPGADQAGYDKPVITTTPATPVPAETAPAPAPAAVPSAPPPATPPTQPSATPPPHQPAAGGTRITLPSGQVVSAPNEAAAAAVRTALTQPVGHGDVATTAYSGTGVSIPTDGAEPGRKVDPADLQPGDIAVFNDHTALVAGNGQLVGADGKLQPLGVINDATNFHGFFRPTETADTPAAASTPASAPTGVSAPTPAASSGPLTVPLAATKPAAAATTPAAAPPAHVR